MEWVTEEELEGLQAKVTAAEAAYAKADAEYRAEEKNVHQIHAQMEADGEEITTSGDEIWRLETVRRTAQEALNTARWNLKNVAVRPAEDVPETGHYDDSHAFGWRPPPVSSSPTETGHYDDGHSFGWRTKKKVAVIAIGLAGVAAAIAGAFAVFGNGGKSTPAASSTTAPASTGPVKATSTTVPTVGAALPANAAVVGCIAIDPQGSTTVLHEAFLLTNPQPGGYTATFAQGPTGPVTGTGAASGNLVETAVTISAFGTYDGLSITAPDGTQIALGPIASQLPLVINAETDKPNGCDGAALVMPAGTGDPVARDHGAIEAFLPTFSDATRSNNAEQLVRMLDPAVLERYSAEQCLADLQAIQADPSAAFVFKSFTSGPEPFTYASDGQSTVVDNTYTVSVSRTENGTTADAPIHLSVSPSGTVGWFTDCTH
jgi:hypothetical protein